jgi:colanic acid/amylovoran/stewartan biosynthesis glycosyltransferase WcaL/AmsK/CpsK
MRVAFLLGDFPALSETFVLDQITGLIDRGHAVDVYAENSRHECTMHPVIAKYGLLGRTQYERLPSSRGRRLLGALRLLAPSRRLATGLRTLNVPRYGAQASSLRLLYAVQPLLPRRSYDIVHCHFAGNGLKAVLLRDLGVLDGKIVTSLHGVDVTAHSRIYGRRQFQRLFATGDLFLPISGRWTDLLVAMGCDPTKVVIHRMGVDCRRFPFIPRRSRAGAAFRIVTVARLVEKKGIEDGIQAVERMKRAGDDVEYLVVGEGPLFGALQRTIDERRASGFVSLLGARSQDEVEATLRSADVFLAPSFTATDGDIEGIPVSIMEAMASGLPVVATAHSAIPELVADAVSGYLVAERDIEGMVRGLRHLLARPDVRLSMGREGRRIIERDFNVDRLNDRLVDIYESLAASDRPANH